MKFEHKPIMLNEVIENLNIDKSGAYLDGTIGGAGHSVEILKRLDSKGILIGIDRDSDALKAADEKLSKISDNYKLVKEDFKNVERVLSDLSVYKLNGVLLDLGVSSYQIDNEGRGFSYINDVDLDMRMDTMQEFSAYDVVNNYTLDELVRIFRKYGGEKFAYKIAKNIVSKRQNFDIKTSKQLNDIIDESIPKRALYGKGHSSRKIFQAIRIEVNGELDGLEAALKKLVKSLKKGGRIAIISFHSLEDRIVKTVFKDFEKSCVCPSDFPVCRCEKVKELKVINKKPIIPSEYEQIENTRSKSAKLRIAEKLV